MYSGRFLKNVHCEMKSLLIVKITKMGRFSVMDMRMVSSKRLTAVYASSEGRPCSKLSMLVNTSSNWSATIKRLLPRLEMSRPSFSTQ